MHLLATGYCGCSFNLLPVGGAKRAHFATAQRAGAKIIFCKNDNPLFCLEIYKLGQFALMALLNQSIKTKTFLLDVIPNSENT